MLLFVAMFSLERTELAPTHTPRAREVLSLYLGCGALFWTLLHYVVAAVTTVPAGLDSRRIQLAR